MRKISALLTTIICFLCCVIWVFSSCTPETETQDEFGDDYVAREYDQAIKELPNQNIPWDLCGAWKKVDDGTYRNPEDLIITSEGKLSGIDRSGVYGSDEEVFYSIVGLCYYNLKHFMWIYSMNRVSTEEFAVAIYWDPDALILADTYAVVYSRDGEPVDSKIFSNRDSRLIGRWKSITGASRIVYNSDGTGSFNGSSFSNWCTIGDYVLHQYYDEYYLVDAYRYSGDILSLDSVDPTYQDWDKNVLNYARE